MLKRYAISKSTTFLIVLFCMQFGTSCEAVLPMGSILFEDHGFAKKCFVQNDVALLSTRLKFQDLLLNDFRSDMFSEEGLTAIIKYFYQINQIIERMSEDEVQQIVQKSFYDLLGSFLKHQLMPLAKYSFYSGNVTLTSVQNMFSLYERCKELLNTNGNGWADPISDFSQFKAKIEKIEIKRQSNEDESMKACANLAMNQNDGDNEEDMLVPLPKFETDENQELSTIWLPLKRKRIFNIKSKTSAFIIFRYYVMVTQCYRYQGINQSIFNRELKTWIVKNVLPYLEDDQLYPTFGAVLRVLETVKEPNESNYLGTRSKSSRIHRLLGAHSVSFDDDNDSSLFNFSSSNGDELDWWFRMAIAASSAIVMLLLLIFCCVRVCKNRKKIQDERMTNPSKKLSFSRKIKDILWNSSKHDEPGEFYDHKRYARGERSLSFENEKLGKKKSFWAHKSRSKKTKEQIALPLLGNETESDDEVVLHKTPLGKNASMSGSSVSQAESKKKEASKARFKISESSDEGEKRSKSLKSSIQAESKSQRRQAGIFDKFRLKSPDRGKSHDHKSLHDRELP